MSLGGYVTEEMVFGDVTTGPSNDLQVATSLARSMVTRFGMSPALGPVAFENDGGRAMFGGNVRDEDYSEKVGAEIDAEVSRIMKEAYSKAKTIITDHKPLLDAVAKRLIAVETIEREEYESMLVAHGVQPKKLETV
jgi:cell division protease FtsH